MLEFVQLWQPTRTFRHAGRSVKLAALMVCRGRPSRRVFHSFHGMWSQVIESFMEHDYEWLLLNIFVRCVSSLRVAPGAPMPQATQELVHCFGCPVKVVVGSPPFLACLIFSPLPLGNLLSSYVNHSKAARDWLTCAPCQPWRGVHSNQGSIGSLLDGTPPVQIAGRRNRGATLKRIASFQSL